MSAISTAESMHQQLAELLMDILFCAFIVQSVHFRWVELQELLLLDMFWNIFHFEFKFFL